MRSVVNFCIDRVFPRLWNWKKKYFQVNRNTLQFPRDFSEVNRQTKQSKKQLLTGSDISQSNIFEKKNLQGIRTYISPKLYRAFFFVVSFLSGKVITVLESYGRAFTR